MTRHHQLWPVQPKSDLCLIFRGLRRKIIQYSTVKCEKKKEEKSVNMTLIILWPHVVVPRLKTTDRLYSVRYNHHFGR